MTPATPFADRLAEAVQRCGTPVMVGLDPRADQLPPGLLPPESATDRAAQAAAFRTFCREVLDVVAPLVGVVKPQAAFFEQLGPPGMQALAEVIADARARGLLVVLDAKRHDIGSTAEAYAEGYLGADSAWGADAMTVGPYLGDDSLEPFVATAQSRGAGLFVLVKTSNPGGALWQDLLAFRLQETPQDEEEPVEAYPLFLHVAGHVEHLALRTLGRCGYGSVGAVVGATFPEQLADLRQAMPHAWLLVPGYGAQGATAADVAAAFDDRGLGAVVNSSRGIVLAYREKRYAAQAKRHWQAAVEAATRDMIDQLRQHTPAGRLAGNSAPPESVSGRTEKTRRPGGRRNR